MIHECDVHFNSDYEYRIRFKIELIVFDLLHFNLFKLNLNDIKLHKKIILNSGQSFTVRPQFTVTFEIIKVYDRS